MNFSWFRNLNTREQLIVLLLGFVLVAGGLYQFAVEPLTRGIRDRNASVQAQRVDLAWMKQQSAAVIAAGPRQSGGRRPLDKAPYLLLDDAIRKAKIKTPDRVQPSGNEGATAQFSQVEFDKLLKVLGELEQTYGLAVKTLNVSKKGEGLVSARLSLEVQK